MRVVVGARESGVHCTTFVTTRVAARARARGQTQSAAAAGRRKADVSLRNNVARCREVNSISRRLVVLWVTCRSQVHGAAAGARRPAGDSVSKTSRIACSLRLPSANRIGRSARDVELHDAMPTSFGVSGEGALLAATVLHRPLGRCCYCCCWDLIRYVTALNNTRQSSSCPSQGIRAMPTLGKRGRVPLLSSSRLPVAALHAPVRHIINEIASFHSLRFCSCFFFARCRIPQSPLTIPRFCDPPQQQLQSTPVGMVTSQYQKRLRRQGRDDV